MRIRVRPDRRRKIKKLEHDSALCGRLKAGNIATLPWYPPKSQKPPEVFWQMMSELYQIHSALQSIANTGRPALWNLHRNRTVGAGLTGGDLMATTSLWHIEGSPERPHRLCERNPKRRRSKTPGLQGPVQCIFLCATPGGPRRRRRIISPQLPETACGR